MKFTKHTLTSLLYLLDGKTISGKKEEEALQPITDFLRHEHNAKNPEFKNLLPDIGVLDKQHRRMVDASRVLLACPDTCTNEPLCDCIRAYYTDSEETCLSIELSACRKGEFASCYPVDPSKDFYVGQDIANAYHYCTRDECLDLAGVKSVYDNETLTYSCWCQGFSSMCEKCSEIKDNNPYCNWLLTSHEGMCSDLIDCCGTETSMDGFRKCINIIKNALIENADETPVNKTDQSVLLACPDTCTNKPLCDCIRAYYTDSEETCLSIELSACKRGEIASCYPVDSSKNYLVGQGAANAYAICAGVECLDLAGVKSLYDNETLAYSCWCTGYTSMCKNCSEIQESNPYCNWLLTSHEGMCSDLIDCCAAATSTQDVRKCQRIVNQAYLENQDALSTDQSSSFGLKSDYICTVAVLASAVVLAEVMM
jgi:hypothetical protein